MSDYVPLTSRFERILSILSSQQFLNMEGLGNEVPFFICAYAAREAGAEPALVRSLVTQLRNRGIRVLEVNLYSLSIQLLQDRGVLDSLIEQEPDLDPDQMLEPLRNVLNPEKHLVPAIGEQIAEQRPQVMLVSGVGAVYPYVRSHTVLNNLQDVAKGFPTVMFYPGDYTHTSEGGTSLRLFGLLESDRYYRAFDLAQYHLSGG